MMNIFTTMIITILIPILKSQSLIMVSDDYSSVVESSVEKDDYGREIKRTKLYE